MSKGGTCIRVKRCSLWRGLSKAYNFGEEQLASIIHTLSISRGIRTSGSPNATASRIFSAHFAGRLSMIRKGPRWEIMDLSGEPQSVRKTAATTRL